MTIILNRKDIYIYFRGCKRRHKIEYAACILVINNRVCELVSRVPGYIQLVTKNNQFFEKNKRMQIVSDH